MLYPQNFEHKIAFDQVRELIKKNCLSLLAMEIVDAMKFSSDFDKVLLSLTRIEEMMMLISESEESMPLGSMSDLRSAFQRTQAEGTFLDVKDVVNIRTNIKTLREVTNYLRHRDEERFPSLVEMAQPVMLFPQIEQRVDSLIDKYGEVKDSASPELATIRRSMQQAQSSISKTLHAILRQAQESGIVEKDASPTMRDGRLVIPILSANKRKISGVVHDESATGKTAYVEPTAVMEVNNRLRELENEERREIVRLLVEFTDFMRPLYSSISDSLYFLAKVDALRAKSQFSLLIGAIKPHFTSDCIIDWHEARHPLLELSLKKQGRKIEPLSIKLNNKQRLLLISGPNAGGKSVCLKTVGLLQYMFQCGLPIPLHERSSAGFFQSIFIDIGDEQSIENDLSTYSSHLLNMKQCVRHSNKKSLLLIDEFGTGTEPQIGGAIAEALLDRFNTNGAYGVITTHYTNLKHYAANTEGVVNGAMLYDRNQMQPLFMLSIGTAGSSFAIEIARKIGLPEDVIAAASVMVGADQVDFDKHLQDVARDKRYWENKRQQVRNREKRLQQLTEQYEKRLEEMRIKEKETLREAKQQAANILSGANAQIERTIREIKENKADKEATLKTRDELNKMKQKLSNEGQVQQKQKQKKPLKVGDSVIIIGQKIIGQLLEIKGKTAIVAFGQIKSTVALDKLDYVSATKAKQLNKQYSSVSNQTSDSIRQRQLNFKQELDIRGMRVDEGLQAVIYFLDDASMLNISQVRILHGTGTGVLRKAVRDYLNIYSSVKSFRDEHVQFGGAGITIVEFE
ncbi:MAG: endonuclease MutS2 [bacterium]